MVQYLKEGLLSFIIVSALPLLCLSNLKNLHEIFERGVAAHYFCCEVDQYTTVSVPERETL